MLNTISLPSLRNQFPKVIFLRLNGSFQNLEFRIKYQIPNKAQTIPAETDLCGHKQQQSSSGYWYNNYDCDLTKSSFSPLGPTLGPVFLNRICRECGIHNKSHQNTMADIHAAAR